MPPRIPRAKPRIKPSKPRADWPLTANSNGQWSKKIRQKVYYFGVWEAPQEAMANYLAVKDELFAGRTPRNQSQATIETLVNAFVRTKTLMVDDGRLAQRTMEEYVAAIHRVCAAVPRTQPLEEVRPADFERLLASFPKTWGLVRRGNEIRRIRVLFNYAHKQGITTTPMRFGEAFRLPSPRDMRLHRQSQPAKLLAVDEVRAMLRLARGNIRAMILLGVNAGYGNHDVGYLRRSHLAGGFATFPRHKTGVNRRTPLWPETLVALEEAARSRPEPANEADADLVFLTRYGSPWTKDDRNNPLSHEIRKLLDQIGVRRRGVNFYALRHTFRTLADDIRDPVAVRGLMGHAPPADDMGHVYQEDLPDWRLQQVTNYVRARLLGGAVL